MNFLRENGLSRKKSLPVRGRALTTPIYFPSISSVKTGLNPLDYFKILKALDQSHFLVSAFDISRSYHKKEFVQELKNNLENDGAIILMDSGNYEGYWLRDKEWHIEDFNAVLSEAVCDLAFCFDNQFPPNDLTENILSIRNSTAKSQAIANMSSIIPIIHCKRENLNDTVMELYNQAHPAMISIPERILGSGILERVQAVTSLRKELNKIDNYVYIHLLGTGNPFSLLLFSLAGADSFDGLEWCQTVVDSKTALLHHFQQRELVTDDCAFCNTLDLDYTLSSLGHNIAFYRKWMTTIQDAIYLNAEGTLLEKHFNANIFSSLSKIWA